MSGTETYQEYVLNADDVCNGCLRVVRVDRVAPSRTGLAGDGDTESNTERRRRTTEIDHGPAESVSEQKGVFCTQCGTESVYDRYWDDDNVDETRFRELLRNLLRTLDSKGVTVHDQQTAAGALHTFHDNTSVDEALAAGVERGLAIAVAATSPAVPRCN